MSNREEALYVISVAAEMSGMHPQTLRIYERRGLIEPYRTPGGTRRYSEADIERLSLIQELTSAGVNLEGVRRILFLEQEVSVIATRSIACVVCWRNPTPDSLETPNAGRSSGWGLSRRGIFLRSATSAR